MTHDTELLARHRDGGDPAAFAALVRRHVGWIHGVARRRLRDAAGAEDVVQAVFVLLHRKSPRFASDRSLVAWLHRAAWYASEVAARQQRRRQRHETEAAVMKYQQHADAADPQWQALAPLLDELIERLPQADREAVLLRYYRQMTFAEVGAATGATEEAARKRVGRAIDRLRRMAADRGVAVTAAAAALGMMLDAQVVSAAPPGLVATATAAALADGGPLVAAPSHALAGGAAKLIALAHAKAAAAAVVAVLVTVTAGASAVVVLAAHSPATRPTNARQATTATTTTTAATRPAYFTGEVDYPKLAPFDAVRWDGDVPSVRVDDVWCELVAIDDLAAGRIVEFCKTHAPDQPQERFEEDLVEILHHLGHAPGERVKLTVRSPRTGEVTDLHDVAMTRDNRRQLWHARQQLELRRRQDPGRAR